MPHLLAAPEAERIPLVPGTIWDRIGWLDQIWRNTTGEVCVDCGANLNHSHNPSTIPTGGYRCAPCTRRRVIRGWPL